MVDSTKKKTREAKVINTPLKNSINEITRSACDTIPDPQSLKVKAESKSATTPPVPLSNRHVRKYTSIGSKTKASEDYGESRFVEPTETTSVSIPHAKLETGVSSNPSEEEQLYRFVSSIVEEKIDPATPPIVQMPKSLSSKMSNGSVPKQPVVVLPLKATMRPGLSVNFGVSAVDTRESLVNINSRPSGDQISPKYTSTSVEASILPPTHLEASELARRGHLSQRGNSSRESFVSPPPGLASDPSSEYIVQGQYPTKQTNRYPGHVSGTQYSSEEPIDQVTGLHLYYAQPVRSPYNQSQARSIDFAKPSGDSTRHGQQVGASWSNYSNPQGASYYHHPNMHYSQHVYQDAPTYPQPPYGLAPAPRFSSQAAGAYATNPYGAGFYTSNLDHGFNSPSARQGMPQASRQNFPTSFQSPKNL